MFAAIVLSALQVGHATSFAPDYGKAKVAAARIFELLDQKPTIEYSDSDGKKEVIVSIVKTFVLMFGSDKSYKIK